MPSRWDQSNWGESIIILLYRLHIHYKFTTKHVWNFPFVKAILQELLHPQTPGELVAGQTRVTAAELTKPSPTTEFKANFPLSSLGTGMGSWDSKIPSDSSSFSWRRRQRRWFQAQYLTQLNYTWLLFASHSLKRIPLPDLSVSAPLKLSTFIHMYG